jgi:hypothetical protein
VKPRYADVAATLALVLAVAGGGTALAVTHLPKNSVTSKAIKNGTIKAKDLAPGTVPTVLQPAVVAGPVTGGGGTTFTNASLDVGTVTITAPAAGYVELTGQATFRATTKSLYLRAEVREATTLVASAQWGAGPATGNFSQAQTLTKVVPVTAGTHTYVLSLTDVVADNDHSAYAGGQLVAAYFPAGGVS